MNGVPYGMGSKPKTGPNFGWATQGPRISRQAKTQGFLRPTVTDVSPVSAPLPIKRGHRRCLIIGALADSDFERLDRPADRDGVRREHHFADKSTA